MRKLFPFILILCLSTSLYPKSPVWEKNLKTTLAKAEKEDKLIMVDVYTDWCGYCTKLDQETYTDAAVLALSKKFYCLKINPEKDDKARLDFIRDLKYSGFPVIFFMNAKRELFGKIDGYVDGPAFAQMMETVLKNKPSFPALRQGQKKGDLDPTISLIDTLLATGLKDEATGLIVQLKGEGKLPQKSGYYFTLGYSYLSAEDWANAHSAFKTITEILKDESDEYYQGLVMSLYTLYMTGEKKTALDRIKANIGKKNSHSKNFQDLLDYLTQNAK